MSPDSLDAALAAGTVVVTPNNRLARAVVQRYDAARLAAGLRTWPAARALPFAAFVEMLSIEGRGGERAVPIAPAASLHLWQSIVEAEERPLLDARGAARAASEAFGAFHAYRRPEERIEAWLGANVADDVAAFARWTARYRDALRARDLVDRAEVPDRLIARGLATAPPLTVALAGFVELTPQQARVIEALRAGGHAVERVDAPRRTSERARVACRTATDELVAALTFARDRVVAAPGARVGVVVQDLRERRADVVALAEEILAPAALVPLDPRAPRPYGISLGVPLADVPLVTAALDLIALAAAGLPAMTAAAAVRSPYLPDAGDNWSSRGQVERLWREQGRRTVRLRDLARTLAPYDAPLAARLVARLPQRATPRDLVDAFASVLEGFGWPGTRTLDSVEWQARTAWQELLVDFAGVGEVAATLDAADAVRSLRDLARERLWAPQSGPAPIQILGMLEAAGLEFDALWLAGLSADTWPPAPRPNPFLPIAWQRQRGVPRASAARDLDYAAALTETLAHAADHVVASHAEYAADAPQTVSPLVADWPCAPEAAACARLRDDVACGARGALEDWQDDVAPGVPAGADAGGGTGLIESQSTCPFQAFARYRLRTEEWPEPDEGLSPKERGNLLHHALKEFWDDVQDHDTLLSLDAAALRARVTAAVEVARGKVPPGRWRSLAPAIAAGEGERLVQTILLWLDHERARPPFSIYATERDTRLTLGGLRLRFRVDRVDRLVPEGIGIIDYKSGRAMPPSAWFKARPAGTQVGLYALAQRAEAPTRPVHLAAYAQIRAGEIKVCGIASAQAWPGLPSLDRVLGRKGATFADAEQHWSEALTALAEEFRRGDARVTPRNRAACERCDLQPLCRIRSVHHDAREPLPAESDEE